MVHMVHIQMDSSAGHADAEAAHARARSLSNSSATTLTRSTSLKDTIASPAQPHNKATPPPSRRRSSAAGFGLDADVNGWSQSTSPRRQRDRAAHHSHHTHHQSSGSRSIIAPSPSILQPPKPPTFAAVNGASSSASPSHQSTRTAIHASSPSSRSPAPSPQRRVRPRSPQPPPSVTAPQVPSLPLLPSTFYGPGTPNSISSSGSFSTTNLFATPSAYTSTPATDYFSSKPQAAPPTRGLGKSPLGSPPIGVLESEARYRSGTANLRHATSNRSLIADARDTAQRRAPSAGHERSGSKEKGTRHRSDSITSNSRLDENYQGTPPRSRERREKDKKTMLSRALQKANTAVLLDNAQNFEGAMEAYSDACKLLQQVMIRSSGEEDKRKLDSIRVTYTNRIEELRRLDPGLHSAERPLPARPMSNESLDEQRSMLFGSPDDEVAVIQTATATRIINDRPVDEGVDQSPHNLRPLRTPTGVRESVISSAIRDVQRTIPDSTSSLLLQLPPGRLGDALRPVGTPGLESPMDRSYMPPPLTPKRPTSPLPLPNQNGEPQVSNTLLPPEQPYQPLHKRGNSNESTSWLDTIDESGGSSCSSSVHSLSPNGLRRKHIRNASGATEAEFDAALDAAVEAAYDDGYEPYEGEEVPDSSAIITSRFKDIEIAKERVREAERDEIIAAAKYRYNQDQARDQGLPHVRESAEFNFQDEAEEEERLLDEMTREYMLDGFDFDLQTKSALPRQSDSSGFSGTTYHSSVSSHRTTGGTSLSTVAELVYPPQQKIPAHSPPPVPTLPGTLSSVAESHPPEANDASQKTPPPLSVGKEATSVRNRRLSGNARTLKIETSLSAIPSGPHTEQPVATDKESRADVPPLPKTAATATFSSTQPGTETLFRVPSLQQIHQSSSLSAPLPQGPIPSPADTTFTVSPATPAVSNAMSNDTTLVPSSPKTSKPPTLSIRKNKSSLSLKQRTLSISSPDGSDGSIGTPLSTTFSFTGVRKQSNPMAPAPTPTVPTFNVDGLPSGGMHLLETDIHSPHSPGSPSDTVTNAPIPLEPCPDSYLLRPFWLMRSLYQTIAHPRGGYVSSKLFIPRDVWRIKGINIKYLDHKIANCDLLTAALQRLSAVDTLDADAVLEEMQAFELVLDQVQTQLAKKLGNEVGAHSVSSLFKDASTVGIGASTGDGSEKGSHGSQDHAPKSAVSQSKSYLTSWRKLRSKNSGVGLNNLAKATGTEVPKDSLTMPSLPMTNLGTIRFAKRDVASVVFEGSNSGYMSSLARLFDAVQILDQIARQVEDPGLKHSSPTHVGLELSTRHAAEFFGFYICRFVLADMMMLLDRFIKEGSKWVLV